MNGGRPREEFISEELIPVAGAGDAAAMARGEPGLPARFTWRGGDYAVAGVLKTWKTSSREGGRADGELYLRRHWYQIVTAAGDVMNIYCERQARNPKRPKARWWIYTIERST